MISMSKEKLFEKIENMTIYEEDYPIIKRILETNDPQFISAVIEEIIKGNLYWADFKEVLPKDYRDILRKTLEEQNELANKIEIIRKFNEETKGIEDINRISGSISEHIGLVPNENDQNWATLSEEMRNDILYILTTYNMNDTVLSRRAKVLLLNAIENGKIILDQGGSISETQFSDKDHLYLDPNALLISNDKLIVPVSYDSIILTDADRGFMDQNNLTSSEMKKIKATYNYLKIKNGD